MQYSRVTFFRRLQTTNTNTLHEYPEVHYIITRVMDRFSSLTFSTKEQFFYVDSVQILDDGEDNNYQLNQPSGYCHVCHGKSTRSLAYVFIAAHGNLKRLGVKRMMNAIYSTTSSGSVLETQSALEMRTPEQYRLINRVKVSDRLVHLRKILPQ